jgi:hypothetical protein
VSKQKLRSHSLLSFTLQQVILLFCTIKLLYFIFFLLRITLCSLLQGFLSWSHLTGRCLLKKVMLQTSCAFWLPAQTLNFKLVPPAYRYRQRAQKNVFCRLYPPSPATTALFSSFLSFLYYKLALFIAGAGLPIHMIREISWEPK